MSESAPKLKEQALQQILEVTRKLAAPFDLDTMLSEVVDAARSILDACGVQHRDQLCPLHHGRTGKQWLTIFPQTLVDMHA